MSRDGVTGLVMLLVGLVTLFALIPTQISRVPPAMLENSVSPKAFPQVGAWGVTSFGALLAVQDVLGQRRNRGVNRSTAPAPLFSNALGLSVFFVAIAIYVTLLPVLGHLIVTPLAIVGYMLLLGERRWPRIVLTAALTTAALTFFFRTLLNTILPTGIFY